MKNLLMLVGIALLLIIVGLINFNEIIQVQDIMGDADEDTSNIEIYDPFFSKKIILRDDDVFETENWRTTLTWIVNLTIEKNMKLTMAVVPKWIQNNVEAVEYLNQLDKGYFEFATHGYYHSDFRGVPYEEQFALIENGTKIMEECLPSRPYTFIPPFGRSDVNTSKAVNALGYHSITDMKSLPCYVVPFFTDCSLEYGWPYPPLPDHLSFEEVKNHFDEFYDSSDDYYIILFHDFTYILEEEVKLNETRTDNFEEILDYISSKHVQFMTIEEAFRMKIDEDVIKTGMINESSYFIDLSECIYNHTIKIYPPSTWKGTVYILDDTTGEETLLDDTINEFDGIKGHVFYLNHI
jgi:peptidoglycan/xylan/chitin deacetylase (PgdA/CDA1 family)